MDGPGGDMDVRPGSELMMAMGGPPSDHPGSRGSGGPGGSGMQMMGMRPGSAAMMMGMGGPQDMMNGMMGPGGGGGDGMMMIGPDGMPVMMTDFDPHGFPPPDMMGGPGGRMPPGGVPQRMMGPPGGGDMPPGMRYDVGSGQMIRMGRPPRNEMEFRMMQAGGGAPYPQGMRNGGGMPPDRQQQMMMMGGGPPGGMPPSSSVGGMPPGSEFGPVGSMSGPMPMDGGPGGAHFHQFQQQLYATKGQQGPPQHPGAGPPSPMSMMMDSRGGGPPFSNYDPDPGRPSVRFGPPQ